MNSQLISLLFKGVAIKYERMKYGMLIVDDEYLVRRGVRETIDWQAIDVEIVGKQRTASRVWRRRSASART